MTRALARASLETFANRVTCCDWQTLANSLPSASIDLCLTDTPYGTTACEWDTVIDLGAWWEAMRRVMKPRGAVVMTASQPYTSELVMSNREWFRYEWVWEKDNGTNFLMLDWQPFKVHENVLIFAPIKPKYCPQFEIGKPYRAKAGMVYRDYLGAFEKGTVTENDGTRHPRSVLKINQERGLHPTQKPIALFEYLIRTYTRPGDLVFDPFVGSGTTAIAARNTKRRFVVGDIDPVYVDNARDRLDVEPFKPIQAGNHDLSDLPLFAHLADDEVAR